MRRAIGRIHRLLSGKVVRNSRLGENVRVELGATIIGSTIGRDTYIGPDVRLFYAQVGAYVSMGPRVVIGENEHEMSMFSTSDVLLECLGRANYNAHKTAITTINPDVWIGAGAFIRKGLRLGVGAVVGAHAVVLKDVPDYAIVVGVPAQIIGYRFSHPVRERLLRSKWWEMDRPAIQASLVSVLRGRPANEKVDEEDILLIIERFNLQANDR